MEKHCQIVIVGHHHGKLTMSIDKEIVHKLIFITEKEMLYGTEEAEKTLRNLLDYYKKRKVVVESIKFDFSVQTKPIAQLIHLIYQQKLAGFDEITVNISGGLRYINVWFYIACSITNTRIIHGDYIYEGKQEVGITSNINLTNIPLSSITKKQFEFLSLFFPEYKTKNEFFNSGKEFNEIAHIKNRITYNSLEEVREALEKRRGTELSRGSIKGFTDKLKLLSALDIVPNPDDKKERQISISYLGIGFFLHYLFSNF